MKQIYQIDLLEEYPNVNFYSIHLDDEELTELERFFEKFPVGCEYDEDIDVIVSWLDKIAEVGALERYFRPEGHYGDGVGVIPIDVGNKIRLYCLRLSDKILVFGNGGVKDTPTWEESEELAPYVKILIDTSRFISSRIKNGTIVLVDKEIIGDLNLVEMKRSRVLEERRKHVNPETRERVSLSFQIVDRIHEILVQRNLRQKDLAEMLGKSEAEISKWMRGTHNFTIDTVVSIEEALQAPVLQVYHETAIA